MVRNKKRDSTLRKAVCISIILSLVAFLASFFVGIFDAIEYIDETTLDIKISSYEDLKNWRAFCYNKNIVLENDIYVTDADFKIGDEAHNFCGKLNGNGHIIYFDFSYGNEKTSFLGNIAPGAIVENVTFKYGKINLDCSTFGGIAKINQGTIRNCKIECDEIIITKPGAVSPLVTTNKGNIFNVVVDCVANGKYIKNIENEVFYGNICVNNYGTISNSISFGKFKNFECTNESDVFSMSVSNKSIASTLVRSIDGGSLENVVAVVEKGVYVCDNNINVTFFNDVHKLLTKQYIFYKYDFNNGIWEILDDTLKIKILEKGN